MRRLLNLILLAILLMFAGYEIAMAAWNEPGAEQAWTLSEWIWNIGPWAQGIAAAILAWAILHFIKPEWDPFLRLARRK